MRMIGAMILATTLAASSAIAADNATPAPAASQTGPLSAGQPAGVRQADIETGGVLLWGGIALAAGAIAIIASNTQGNGATSTGSTGQ